MTNLHRLKTLLIAGIVAILALSPAYAKEKFKVITTFTAANLEQAFSGVLRHIALSGGEEHIITDDERPFISRRVASGGKSS
ncbi:hypothetical protein JD879_003747 [Salmonella enterica subsp. enterica serovar Kentucky]|nr:hypothetical protein [Salmonella enterica subsp. enterica serovar Kentucky]